MITVIKNEEIGEHVRNSAINDVYWKEINEDWDKIILVFSDIEDNFIYNLQKNSRKKFMLLFNFNDCTDIVITDTGETYKAKDYFSKTIIEELKNSKTNNNKGRINR